MNAGLLWRFLQSGTLLRCRRRAAGPVAGV